MLPSAEFAKIDAWRKGDAGAFEDVVGEGFAVVCERADVGVDEESAVRDYRDFEADVGKCVGEVISTRFKLGSARFGNRISGVAEAGERGMLRERSWRNIEILGKLFEIANVAFWRDKPAEPPAGHVEVLGETVH